jgi:hypothetical protein
MGEQCTTLDREDADIAAHEVSEDGVTWRPYDAATDANRTLHTRIVFAPPSED